MTEAEKRAFNMGYLIACCTVVALHGETVVARDVLAELGLDESDIDPDLNEFDAKILRELRKEFSTNDPIGKPAKAA